MNNLKELTLGFVENYVGDDGISELSKVVKEKLPSLKRADLDLSFNDAKGYGGIAVVKNLAERKLDYLALSLSNNEFRDSDVKLMKPHFKTLIRYNKLFELEFVDTAISNIMMNELKKQFDR